MFKEFSTANLIGVEANDFDMLKILVVSRPKSQNVIIDKAGLTVTSTTDKNVKLFTPRDAFSTRTNVRLSVRNQFETSLNRNIYLRQHECNTLLLN